MLAHDFGTDTLNLTLSDIAAKERSAEWNLTYTGPERFTWAALAVGADGTLGLSDHGNGRADSDLYLELGSVDCAFYGPGSHEAAGVLEPAGVTGAFGVRCR